MFRRHTILMYSGIVSNWKQGSPYGFVKDADTGASYFLHKDDIVDGNRNRISSLPEGFRVEFDKAMFEGRTKAVAVTLRGGAPITSTGDSRRNDRDDDDRGERRNSRDRGYDRDERRDDRRNRDDDRDDRRSSRDYDRDERRDDRRSESMAYDKELSRIQGSLKVMSRTATNTYRSQQKLYSALVTLADARGVVVPGRSDETKAASTALWAKYREVSDDRKEKSIARKNEKRAEFRARRDAETAETQSSSSSKPTSTVATDAEDMF